MIETINKIVRTQRRCDEFGREPTPEELAKKLAMPVEKERKVLKITKPVSLETQSAIEDSSLGDFIEDKNACNHAQQFNQT